MVHLGVMRNIVLLAGETKQEGNVPEEQEKA